VADKPDGRAAGASQRVAFTRAAADRIARVVRASEAGDRSGSALTFRMPPETMPASFRMATFTGSWSVASSKTVTLKYQTTTPNTVSVTNLLFEWPGTAGYDCAIGLDGTAWHLIGVPMKTASLSFLSSVSVAASLNTANCTISVTQTNTTGSSTVVQFKV
jgi:hypothetical protein